MGTRSDIIVKRADGTWARVYCHWDGYLEHNGALLAEHYNSQALAEALVENGDMSSLHEKCDKPDGHSYETQVKGYTVYYHRDRGEPWDRTQPKTGESLAAVWPPADTWTEFTYVWDGTAWWVGDPDGKPTELIELAAALKGEKKIHPRIKAFGLTLGRHA